jgi:uncharacterized membrane protein
MSLLVLILFALLIPVLLFFLFYGLVSISFVRLGVPRSLVALLFISILIGGFVNIPIWEVSGAELWSMLKIENPFSREPPGIDSTVIAVNVGGAIIPLLLSMWLLPRAPLFRTAIATAIVTLVAYLMADVVPGRGIALNALVPPAVSAIAAMVLAWRKAAPVAYISGVLGTLIGGDFLHLQELLRAGGMYLSIGGAGIFDGIFLIGIIAAFLSPGAQRPSEVRQGRL